MYYLAVYCLAFLVNLGVLIYHLCIGRYDSITIDLICLAISSLFVKSSIYDLEKEDKEIKKNKDKM